MREIKNKHWGERICVDHVAQRITWQAMGFRRFFGSDKKEKEEVEVKWECPMDDVLKINVNAIMQALMWRQEQEVGFLW